MMFRQTIHKRVKTLQNQVEANAINKSSQKIALGTQGINLRSSNHKNMHYRVRSNSNMKDGVDSSKDSRKIGYLRSNQAIISSLSHQNNHLAGRQQSNNSKDYQLMSMIGKGTFGKIYKACSVRQRKAFAIKKIYQDQRYQNRELQILKQIKHQNVIRLLDHFYQVQESKKYLYLVMDIYDLDLFSLIKESYIDPMLTKVYLFQVLKGLEYLSSQCIAHRDLKPHNILINRRTHEAVICDFGSAKRLVRSQKNIAYICARCYRAPELILGASQYTTAVDMWAFGCIAAEIVSRKLLFQALSNAEQLVEIMKVLGTPSREDLFHMNPDQGNLLAEKFPSIQKQSLKRVLQTNDMELIDLIEHILVYSPRKRYTPAQALSHPYFSQFRNKDSLEQLLNASTNKCSFISSKDYHGMAKTSLKTQIKSTLQPKFQLVNLKNQLFSDKLQKITIPKLNVGRQMLGV